jgi:hypothetical protein
MRGGGCGGPGKTVWIYRRSEGVVLLINVGNRIFVGDVDGDDGEETDARY